MSVFRIKRGDTWPPLAAVLRNAPTEAQRLATEPGDPIDLTGATVVFSGLARDGKLTLGGACTITDEPGGEVEYEWQVADTANLGFFYTEFVITFAGGGVQSVPSDGFVEIEVRE